MTVFSTWDIDGDTVRFFNSNDEVIDTADVWDMVRNAVEEGIKDGWLKRVPKDEVIIKTE